MSRAELRCPLGRSKSQSDCSLADRIVVAKWAPFPRSTPLYSFLTVLTLHAYLCAALEELSTLPAIEQMGLDTNAFTGIVPPSIGNATTFNYLSMGVSGLVCSSGQRGGGFGGQIPKELGKLVNLSTLWLGCDNLSGQLPPELGNLTLLTSFDLGQNNLSSEIPRSLGSMALLNVLLLFNNELSGPIPSCLGNMTGLTRADFHKAFAQSKFQI